MHTSVAPCILVLSPHPDDEILGCGGSIINRIREGNSVHIAYLSLGENASPSIKPTELGTVRKMEAVAAAGLLGVKSDRLHFINIPDGNIEPSDLESMKKIMRLIRNLKPTIAYLPHANESSYDHRQAHDLCMRAIAMAPSNNYKEAGDVPWWIETVLAYEVWTPIQNFQYTEDITSVIDEKIAALKCYGSQNANNKGPSTYIGEAARSLPAYRGAMSIGGYREAFQILRLSRLPTGETN